MPPTLDRPRGGSALVLFSGSYPYSSALEDSFIEPELPYLQRAFDRVILVPLSLEGTRAASTGVEVDDSLARALAAASPSRLLARALLSSLLWRDVLQRPRLLRSRLAIRRLIGAAGRAEAAGSWLLRALDRWGLRPADCVAYSFWCDHAAIGFAIARAKAPALLAVSRAHGFDLYAERHDPPYLPCRTPTLRALDALFPDSDRGTSYVGAHYPWFTARCETARMGVTDPGFLAPRSPRGRFCVLSCSVLIPLKRVDLILRGMIDAASRRPDVSFEWHHFGDGALRQELESIAREAAPPNLGVRLHGYPGKAELMDFYRSGPVDAFINASVSEGTSVAIMEAISCGVPVIATAVGGNPEIVGPDNGVLLTADPSAAEVGAAVLGLVDSVDTAAAMRTASRRVWSERYDADANLAAFAKRLVELRRAR